MKPLPITVVSGEDAEKAEFVICARKTTPAHFAGDDSGVCCACGEEVRFRPHAPKKPPKMCMECMIENLGRTQ